MTDDSTHDLTRDDLVSRKTGFNQLRNSLYHLQRFMAQKGLSPHEINLRFLKMGENMGATYSKHIDYPLIEPRQFIEKLYRTVIHSKVSVDIQGKVIHVLDKKCPDCKYVYPDIEVAGCNMTVGLVAEILARNGVKIVERKVLRSKTYGDSECVHSFTLAEGD